MFAFSFRVFGNGSVSNGVPLRIGILPDQFLMVARISLGSESSYEVSR